MGPTAFRATIATVSLLLLVTGCAPNLFQRSVNPLQEYTLEGEGREKVLLIPIRGAITNNPDAGFLKTKPGMLQEIVSQLRKAEKDPRIKAILLKIESPGGSSTDSDILFHELERYKSKSGAKVVAVMMGVAASGGYYAALASDRILAHPSSVTGSVGTIFLQPKVQGLMEKIGVGAEVSKSGKYKDMVSPLRPTLPEEREMIQTIIEDLNKRFLDLAARKRHLTEEQARAVATARIFTAGQALEVGLVDGIGYVDDALNTAKVIAGLPEDARVVVYRRRRYPNDHVYNVLPSEAVNRVVELTRFPLSELFRVPAPGFYYLWAPEWE